MVSPRGEYEYLPSTPQARSLQRFSFNRPNEPKIFQKRIPDTPLKSQVQLNAKKKKTGKKCDEMIAIAHLNPGSFFIFSTIVSSFKTSATALLISNPSLDKLMAGWTRSFQGNQPYSFQARYRPLTSPGTAMARPPGRIQ